MASKNHKYTLLNVQNDDAEIDLQFQDFDQQPTSSSNNREAFSQNQAVYFNSFADTGDDDQEQKEPKRKIRKTEEMEIFKGFPLKESINFKSIIAEEFCKPFYIELIVLEVNEKKSISKAVQEISKPYPLPRLLHLKRVRKINTNLKDFFYIILDEAAKFNIKSEENIGDNVIPLKEPCCTIIWKHLKEKNICSGIFSNIFLSKGSLYPPKLRSVYEEVNKVWPCSFHEDLHLKSLLSGSIFNSDEKENIKKFVNKITDIAKTANKSEGLQRVALISRSLNFDTSEKFYGMDKRHNNPLLHSSMIAIRCSCKKSRWWCSSSAMSYEL
ncbi:hypothetical protein Avbf_09176 [Armadillidium vulgare]|nr:hypothetical protein Avbf_09176 [Armadillidium vulgare]